MSAAAAPHRIASMDQFRGYTVAGMFLVNFLGSYACIHPVLRHNDTYFSYADSIMPSFMFAVGFSFRLTYLRRRSHESAARTIWTYVRRSGALIVVSLVLAGFGGAFHHWGDFDQMPDEYQPFRPKAPQTASFDFLMSEAKKLHPALEGRTLIDAASALGASPTTGDSATTAAQSPAAIAAEARRRALSQIEPFIAPAVERKKSWEALDSTARRLVHARIVAAKLLKSDLWETLAIIGAAQLVILPWIGCRFGVRLLVLIGLGVTHLLISGWFNWDFVYGVNDNWMSKWWMTGSNRSWDGGFFGPLSWAMAMTAGTLAYDLVAGATSTWHAAGRMAVWGIAFMSLGYAMSCLTRLYELEGDELARDKERRVLVDAERAWLDRLIGEQRLESQDAASADRVAGAIVALRDQQARLPNLELAESPVMPPWSRLQGRSLRSLLVEPPFVAPPQDRPGVDPPPQVEHRPRNYWMMGKRMPNLSFMTFATGFAFAAYGLFIVLCDVGALRVGIFRTFGTNALVAYVLHHLVEHAVAPLVPRDAPLWYCLAGFAAFFGLTYLCVRELEKRKIYVKL